ncbi:LAGLIDADG family homing endonuclease [Streptomyces sp. NPDC060028]|uniref:LAGLIDADG family homing endonuclease n=1 Tax=Streptomyces sp. NPDC060028 TaxID=3347041 RepID=UPI0036CBB1BA
MALPTEGLTSKEKGFLVADQDPSAPMRFMDLQDPRYAYMFGFLQADGHLARGRGQKGRLTAEINARDIHILREFQQLTPYYSSITERVRQTNFAANHHSATWTVCSLEARTTVNELGIPYGKKSLSIKPPRTGFSHVDYLRGLIDADGSLGWTAQGFPFLSLTSASTAIAAYLCHYGKKITGIDRTISRNQRDGVYNVCYYKETAQQLAAHLYYDGCLALAHKKANAGAIQSWVRPADMRVAPPRRRWTANDDRELLRLNDPAAAGVALNRTAQSCSMRLWRLRTGKT